MRKQLYEILVDSNDSVKFEYSQYKIVNKEKHKKNKIRSWLHLLYLIIKYRIIKRQLNKESKLIFPESRYNPPPGLETLYNSISISDGILFNLFDTMIFKMLDEKEKYMLVSKRANLLNFVVKRVAAEEKARNIGLKNEKSYDIYNIYDNYEGLEKKQIEDLLNMEFETEKRTCIGNSYLRQVYSFAIRKDKPVFAFVNSVWDKEQIHKLLSVCGYDKIEDIFIVGPGEKFDCEVINSKLKKKFPEIKTPLYIGPSYLNINKTVEDRFFACYPEVNVEFNEYRNICAKSLPSSLYKKIVNLELHKGNILDSYYEHAFVYGGFLVYGFCGWLNKLVQEKEIELLLFTARDTESIFRIYKTYFNNCPSKYFFCSRESLLKAAFPYQADIFFEIMIQSKAYLPTKLTIRDVFIYAGLNCLINGLASQGLSPDDIFDEKNIEEVKSYYYTKTDLIQDELKTIKEACILYLKNLVSIKKRICIVDLGWRGTIFGLIKKLLSENLLQADSIGAVVGTIDSDIANYLVDSGQLFAYSFSNVENQDIQIRTEHLMLVETLFSSSAPSTMGYGFNKNNEPRPIFSPKDNNELNRNIYSNFKKGIYEFCSQFSRIEQLIELKLDISGREAYFPLHKICQNYSYNMNLFKNIKTSDIAAYINIPLVEILQRMGYREK